ncbi:MULTISPECIES: MarR family transcriptional regulator [Enterobacterales]|uniref:MarR family transcriptional regulator n=1 Tax=Enterobacterales TaxID=91347 RepID=UPI002ED7FC80
MNSSTLSQNKNLHLGLLFHLANQFKDQLIGHYFSGSGITAPQFKVLINIYKGNTSPAEICKSLQMDTGAMSRMVERMVKNDLIERHPNPQDKRQVILALTEKGQTLCNTFQNEALTTILADLTAHLTPEESRQLQGLLIKMLPDEFTAPHR